jgi:hypothetical protein
VIGVLAGERRAIACYLVGDPAAAGHLAVLSSQFSVKPRGSGGSVWRGGKADASLRCEKGAEGAFSVQA